MDEALRKAALSKFFSKSDFAKETVTDGDLVLEVRQPTVGKRNRIHKASFKMAPIKKSAGRKGKGKGDEEVDVEFDNGEFQLLAVLECTYLPGEAEPFFGPEHRESLVNMPTGGLYDQLAKAAQQMLRVEPEEAAKNSEATPSAASSSS